MTPLYALDSLETFKTFHNPFLSKWHLLRIGRKLNREYVYMLENFPFMKKHKPKEMPWLYLGFTLGYIRYWAIRLLPVFVRKLLQPYGYFVDHLAEDDAFEDAELLERLRAASASAFAE